MTMTPQERFLAHMRFQDVDHVPLWEWGPWPSTLRRWQREALGHGKPWPQQREVEHTVPCGLDMWMCPRYQQRVLNEDDRTITQRTEYGVVTRTFKSPDAMSMPEHLEYPVKTRADWEALKQRFDPADPQRLPADWDDRCRRWRREKPVLLIKGHRSPSLFGFVRELLGPLRALLAFHDEPDLVHDMMEFNADFLVRLMPRAIEAAPISAIFFWEDMCYRGGPLISPDMFGQFMVPRYRKVTDAARRRGVDMIFVDSDGDVSQLIPLWLAAGIDGIYPLEVAAGMDVAKLQRQYGRDLLMTGGIDKRALARDRSAIDAELARALPLAEQGGYIPHLDHAIPHDVPYDNFAYYWQRKKAMLGV